jgi:hypothetical protein
MRELRNWCNTVAIVLLLLTLQSVARADESAYMATGTGQFGTIDLTTGVFSPLGNTGQTLAGLAVVGTTLYGTSYHTAPGTLYQVNTTNGSLTSVGTASIDYDCFGATPNGLYALDTSANLYSINPSTGAATLIGPTGFALGFGSWRGLSTNASVLFFANAANLYTLNTTTGAPTLVGNMGGPQMGAMVMEGGVLYGGVDSLSPQVGASVDTINTVTGAATTGPGLTGTTGTFYALAPTIALNIPQIVDGGPWFTTISVTNTSSTQETVSLVFFQESGGGATLPWNLNFVEMTSTQVQSLVLPGGTTLFLHTPGTAQNATIGWGQLFEADGAGAVVAYAIFTQRVPGRTDQEGTAPAAPAASRILVPFDNTNGAATSMAIANTTASSESINVGIRTSSGTSQPSPITLPAQGHTSFSFSTQFPATAGQSGLAEFYSPSGSFSILALKFNSGAFTTAPVYAESGLPIIASSEGDPPPDLSPPNSFVWSIGHRRE